MKSILLVTLCLCSMMSAAQKEYTIMGSLSNATNGVIYLVNPMDQIVLDSANVKAGTFQLKGPVINTTPVVLAFNPKHTGFRASKDSKYLFIEPGIIKVKGAASINSAEVSGTATNDDVIALSKISSTDSLDHEIDLLHNASDTEQQKTETYRIKLAALNSSKIEKLKASYRQFIRSHPNSLISLRSLNDLTAEEDYAVLKTLFDGLSETLKNSDEGKMTAGRLRAVQKVALGAVIPDISFPDTDGKMISMSAFRGKYILVDFWASWCGPCRQENPNLLLTYNRYKNMNFTILGISLDDEKTKWLQAIEKDGLSWAQLSDLKLWESAAVKVFGINSIPQNYLLDPNGVIVAKNLTGESLNAKLKEVLDK